MFHFDYTISTSKSMSEAVRIIEENLKEDKFGILWQFDVKDKLQEKGVDFDHSFLILEVCNPHEAGRVLNQNKMVGYFLPCKIVVYEENGMTKIGMPRPTVLINMVEDEEVKDIAENIENRLIKCMNKCK